MIKKLVSNKVFKNFSYLTIGSAFSQFISLLATLKVTSLLAPDDYGVFSFLTIQGALLFTIGDLGIRNIVIRSIARNPLRTNDLIRNGAILRSAALLVLCSVYIVYNYALGNLSPMQLLFIFLFSFVTCFSNLFEIAFLGNQKMLVPALVNLGYSVAWFAAVFLLPKGIFNATVLFVVFLCLSALKGLVYFALLKFQHLLIGRIQRFRVSSAQIIRESWPYFVMVLIMLPFTQLSNNFLALNSTFKEVGYFNLSQKLLGPVSLVLDFALAAIFPNLSALWVKDKSRFNYFISIGFKYFMLLGLLLCFLFCLFAKEAVMLLFPTSYLPAVPVCQLQIWYLFLTSLDSLVGTIFGATNKEKLILRIGIANVLVGAPLLYYGSFYGALGLSFGYVCSFAIVQFYLWYVFKKALKIRIRYAGILWLLAIILFLVAYFIPADTSLLYRILLGTSVAGGIGLFVLKTYKSLAIE